MTDFSKSKDYIYEGLVNLENQKNGFGKLISPSLISYEGEWCKDKPIGDFTILYPPDILNESVKYIGTDPKNGKAKLSRKATMPKPETAE